jgi:exodeoxyribonuclease V beta subunit
MTRAKPEAGETAAGRIDAPLYDRRSANRTDDLQLFDPIESPVAAGISLVEASAGTGKTYCITLAVLRLLLEPDESGRERTIGSILVVTFTNAATDELITRIRSILADAVGVFSGSITYEDRYAPLFALRDRYGPDGLRRLRAALASLDQLAVFTIHGFCQRVLTECALESGMPYGAKLVEDERPLVERIAQDWWRRMMYGDDTLAAVAVRKGWKWSDFLDDLKNAQRWPDTRIDPQIDIRNAQRDIRSAMDALATVIDPESLSACLDSLTWLASAPLADPELRGEAVNSAVALGSGDLAGGLLAVQQCTTSALRGHVRKASKVEKAAREGLAEQPVLLAIDCVAAALESLRLAMRVSFIETVSANVLAEKERRHLLGFDDILRRLRDAICTEGPDGHLATSIRRRYAAALIDEFQDTDPFQFPIFSTAFAGRPLFLIGDPKQAIYGFRGADIFAYMKAAAEAERRFTLRSNWRSSQELVAGVNALFTQRANPFLYGEIPYVTVEAAKKELKSPLPADGRGAVHWWYIDQEDGKPVNKGKAEARIHDALADEIVRLLRGGHADGSPFSPGRIAILVRGNREGQSVQKRLRRAGVPAILSGMGDILESPEMAEIERILDAVLRPNYGPAVRAALATELLGRDAASIHALSQPESEGEWQDLVDDLVQARFVWERHGFMRMIQELLGRFEVSERLLAFADGERRVTNLRHAVELLHAVSVEERLSPVALPQWLSRARARNEKDSDRTELRLESDADAVQVMTIHKSKGLEFDVVLCPSLWLPWIRPDGDPVVVHEDDGVVFDHGSERNPERSRVANAERLAEELRLTYVALTRARFRSYVAWGAIEARKSDPWDARPAWASALGYLLRESEFDGSPADIARSVENAEGESVSAWLDRLQSLAARCPEGVMTVELLAGGSQRARWEGTPTTFVPSLQRERLPGADQLETWRVASFTSLTAEKQLEDPRDRADGATSAAHDLPALPRSDIMAFPAGRQAGIALHDIFERLDFTAPSASTVSVVTESLARHGFTRGIDDPCIRAVDSMVARVLAAPLPGAGFSLSQVRTESTLREWKFHLPLGLIERRTLFDLFDRHGDELARRYAPSLRALSPRRTYGFLTGVVDLVLEAEGRWHVLDWKSNHLGTDPAAYAPSALEPGMFDSHYVLQYHLYVTALHRFLRHRLPGYAYSTHMGNVWYAFLRGIDGASEHGWFCHRPAESLIDSLDALMGAGMVAAGGAA